MRRFKVRANKTEIIGTKVRFRYMDLQRNLPLDKHLFPTNFSALMIDSFKI